MCLVVVLFIGLVRLVYSEYFDDLRGVKYHRFGNIPLSPDARSPIYLVQLAKHEADVFQALSELEHSSADKIPPLILDSVRRYQKMYSDEIERVHKIPGNKFYDASQIIGENPIFAFNMIWRFVHELTLIHYLLQPYDFIVEEDTPGEFFFESTITKGWPGKITLDEAMAAILRIQLSYDLDPKQLESGQILETESGAQMSIHQIITLGKFAAMQKRYTLAIPWLELAMDKLFKNPEQKILQNISLTYLESSYSEIVVTHNLELAQNPSEEYKFYKEPVSIDFRINQLRISTRKLSHAEFRKSNSNSGNYVEFYYWSLCSGNNHQTEEEKSTLTCWYDRTSSAALAIYPIKTELLSKKPYLAQLYDVLSDSKILKFLDPAYLKVRRSGVVAETDRQDDQSEIRTSVDLIQSKQYSQLDKYIEIITGLDLEKPHSAEPFHLVSYAFGGHFDCHLDAFPEENVKTPTGNRIATLMFYLDNVQRGGLTAFPRAGVAATPIKGSALLWYNLKRSGIRDRDTLHCACPVIQGRKTRKRVFLNVKDITEWPKTILDWIFLP